MSELTSKRRNNLNDKDFGVPSIRKFPLNDEEHTRKAIQMFHHCPVEYKKELARNIYKKSKKYNIDIDKDSIIYEYLSESIKEEINEIIIDEEADYEFKLLYEAVVMNEVEAMKKVETSITMWKNRKRLIRNQADKNSLLLDLKNENNLVSNYARNGNYDLIISRAGVTAEKIERNIRHKNADSRVNYQAGNIMRKGLSNEEGRIGFKVAGAIGAGVVAGGLTARKANKDMKFKQDLQRANNPTVSGSMLDNAKNKIKQKAEDSGRVAKALGKGAAVGTAVAAAGTALAAGVTLHNKKKAADANLGLKKYAEKYVSFIQGFIDEVNNDSKVYN